MIPYKRRELKLLSTLAVSFVATIQLFYVSKFDQLSLRQSDNKFFLEGSFKKNKLVAIQKPGDDITAEINKCISINEFGMLVMVNQRHSYLENLLYQTTIDQIGLKIKIPFLVLQNLNR